MSTFKTWIENHNTERLEISITSFSENGIPTSTVMKHRNKDGGKWEYDFDLDSGEQSSAKQIPDKVREILKGFGL